MTMSQIVMVTTEDGLIEVHVSGEGPLVVMLPSLGRGAADFDRLAADVAAAGYRVACPEPRGIRSSVVPDREETLSTLAGDVAAVISELGDAPAVIVGHAYGNRIARMTATNHPELVESLVLLACGGLFPVTEEMGVAMRTIFDPRNPPEDRLDAVARAFFAPGNDASVWADGWYANLARAQEQATVSTPVGDWWAGGTAPMLAVQPADDQLAVPANADALVEAVGDRAQVVVIPNAGHALLPEQPDAVAETVIGWLDRRKVEASV
ncbi:MAG: alpha/beta hydrolase [Acidimicrobiia bacterium]|nr:alpha/beta hydrolase [Acidimicrobiia bacterium]MYG59037.1 alpha/beta hydrolase [Acidimicrobiia bacterium]MYJ33171.1 alpha/beta hydrolase [Acidimicrobiia bacterium]